MSGLPAGGPTPSTTGSCQTLGSDTDAVYCGQLPGAVMRIASDGTAMSMGVYSDPESIVSDTYVYWVDSTTDGTIMKTPKAGNGTATVLARDTEPFAMAVDDNSVYWADLEGSIKRIAK